MNWSEDVKAILSCGISLLKSGISNWALTENQSIHALNEFEKLNIPVLGGDVYEMIEGNLTSNYDNWYCNRNENEELNDFVTRSIIHAREYINNYTNPSGRETFFVFVTP